MRHDLRYKVIVLLFGLTIIGCMGSEDKQRLEKLHQIAAETPVYPGFKEIGSHDGAHSANAVLSFYYRSTASYDEVKKFYTNDLPPKGWDGPQDRVNADGTVEIEFRKGEYSVSIFYDESATDATDWNYAISYGWRIP